MNDDQKRLVTSTLKSVLDAAILSSIWQMPLWMRVGLGLLAFGVLFTVLS
jgi:hypothetical protein